MCGEYESSLHVLSFSFKMSSRPAPLSSPSHGAVSHSSNERLRGVLTAGLLHAEPAAVQFTPTSALETINLHAHAPLTLPPAAPRPPAAAARVSVRGWPSWGSVGALFTALDIGGDSDKGKQLRRSERLTGAPAPPQPPILERVETDREWRMVYVDLEPRGASTDRDARL